MPQVNESSWVMLMIVFLFYLMIFTLAFNFNMFFNFFKKEKSLNLILFFELIL